MDERGHKCLGLSPPAIYWDQMHIYLRARAREKQGVTSSSRYHHIAQQPSSNDRCLSSCALAGGSPEPEQAYCLGIIIRPNELDDD